VNDAGSHLRRSGAGEPFPETLARLHNAFEQVHPFLDGHGRTGRSALNLILVRLGVPWLAFTRGGLSISLPR